MKVKIPVETVVKSSRDARVSDISGTEIPSFHWSTVTSICCQKADGAGNKWTVFDFDLMPEEMADLVRGIDELIASVRAKYRSRIIGERSAS